MKDDCDLHEAATLFEPIFAASPWPMLMWDEKGQVLGASDDAAAGKERLDLPLRERASHYQSLLEGCPPWLAPQDVDSSRTLPSGAIVYERLHLRRTSWGGCLTVIDQSELRPLQTVDLQTARLAALGFMVAGVCHEVTNPLTSLHSIVQILRSEKQPSAEMLSRGLDNIAVNVRRILEISRRLLNFSRVGDEPRLRFPIDEAVDEALSILRHDMLLDGIEVCFRPDRAAVVFSNPGQIREVLLNLLVNAVQAMAGNGRLTVTTRRVGPMVEVSIADTGPGVPAEAVTRIFEPFFTTKAASQGTGLGLAISTELVHVHGGSIELRANSTQGACFCITLPRDGS